LVLCDRVKYDVIKEKCSVKEDVIYMIEKNMLRWFTHVDRWKEIDEKRLTKKIYKANLDGNAVKESQSERFLTK
jgi:hypothetical protein